MYCIQCMSFFCCNDCNKIHGMNYIKFANAQQTKTFHNYVAVRKDPERYFFFNICVGYFARCGIQKLVTQWTKCFENKGDYVDK
jgi:hypothetical protein